MNKIRVLLVEDSRTVSQRLIEVLGHDPLFEVVGVATDGERITSASRALRHADQAT